MLKKIDTFLRETKILRFPVFMAAAYLLLKGFGYLMTIAAVLDGTM